PLPPGNLTANDPFSNAKIGLNLVGLNDTDSQDFHKAADPAPGVFALSLPTWNYNSLSQSDSTFGFGYDNSIDPALDSQTFKVTDDFFRQFMGTLNTPKASGTNLVAGPGNVAFSRTLNYGGETWTATHNDGSDVITFTSSGGKKHDINLGASTITSWLSDNASFGDLNNKLLFLLNDH